MPLRAHLHKVAFAVPGERMSKSGTPYRPSAAGLIDLHLFNGRLILAATLFCAEYFFRKIWYLD
jgi:hypothetical protein